MTPKIDALAAALLVLTAEAAVAGPCHDLTHDGAAYTVCEASQAADLRLWLTAEDGLPIATFDRLAGELAPGERVGFAMNAGMYHPDRRPVGLFVQDGVERAKIVTSEGPGNFGMLPNGVFCVGTRFAVIESRDYAKRRPNCQFATQSGPMLVIGGALHPKFLPDSDSRHLRNGVGVSADGKTAWFAISDEPVTFYQFARLFRDGLGARDALFFDGSVSRLMAPDLGRSDLGLPMGPIVGLVLHAD
ncbi:phosphodiester glycosidase family protein [Phaeovulum sp.]|uniref:phosphodiester glycosidase family protein n=1 Tax=Phaeovulum sp. TaxID=2934796 RepID=UPI0039E5033D